jgi:hypothetical protein
MTRQLSYSLFIDWDGSNTFSFNESNYVESISGDESMSPAGESSFSGSGFTSEANINLINSSARFSTVNSSSPIYSYIANGAFLQKKVLIQVTIAGITYTIFRGFIKSLSEVFSDTEKIGVVRVKCRSQDDIIKGANVSTLASVTKYAIVNQLDESELIKRTLEASGLVDNTHFRSQSQSNPTLERGLFTIPYYWLDKESPVEDCWLLAAACAGRFFFNSEDGLFYYKNAFEYATGTGGTSQATITDSNCDGIDFENGDSELIESVNVTAKPRFISETKQVWASDKPIRVAPSTTTTIDCDINKPIIDINGIVYYATSAVGTIIPSGISVTINTIYSQSVKLNVVNSTNRLVFLNNLLLFGKQLEPLDNLEYTKTSTNSYWNTKTGKEKSIQNNPYVQTYAQAKAIGDLTLDRQATFSPKVNIKRYKGNVFLRVGQRITLNISGKFSNVQFIVTKSKWNLSKSGFYQDLELLNASGIYGLAIGDYFIIGTHSQNSNKKLFY